MRGTRKRITVFGGARCNAESAEYQEALKLGRLLVEAGFEVCSGGYAGIMEAISKGAHEAGGHVIGITMMQFAAVPNSYLKKIEPSKDFYSRLEKLINESEGYVALRGGMGTVTEISLVWNKLTTRVMPSKPLILLGDCWVKLMDAMQKHLVVSEQDLSHLLFAATADEAVAILKEKL
ncbi:MAG: LOG family protein [Acidobacteria bacterium]|nr:LOG family protein [Acidobacteriota bacterium]